MSYLMGEEGRNQFLSPLNVIHDSLAITQQLWHSCPLILPLAVHRMPCFPTHPLHGPESHGPGWGRMGASCAWHQWVLNEWMTVPCSVIATLDLAWWSFALVIREPCPAVYLSSHIVLRQEQILLTLDSIISVPLSGEDMGGGSMHGVLLWAFWASHHPCSGALETFEHLGPGAICPAGYF